MARDTIGSMVAVVSATASRFAQDMQAVEGSVTHLKQHVERSAPSGGMADFLGKGFGIGAGIAAAQAAIDSVTGSFRKLSDTIKSVEETSDFAQQINATVNEVQGLRYAADNLGSSASAIDSGLQNMVRRIGEARAGSAQARAAFETLGLSVDALSLVSSGEAFRQIADAFSSIQNPADQAALAVALFGKQGLNLINVLNQGRDNIDQTAASGARIGAVMSNETAAGFVKASEAIKLASAAIDGMWKLLTARLLPGILATVKVVNMAVELFSRLAGYVNANVLRIAAFAAAIVASFVAINKVINAVKTLVTTLRELVKAQAMAQAFAGPKGWLVLGASIGVAYGSVKLLEAAFAEQDATLQKANKTAEDNARAVTAQAEAAQKAAEEAELAAEAQRRMDDLMRRGASIADQMRTPWEKYNDTIDDLVNLLGVGAINFAIFQRAVMAANEELDKATELKENLDRMSSTPGVGAVQQGSTAAFSAIQASVRAQADESRRRDEIAKRQLAEEQRQNETLKRIEQALQRGRNVMQGASI